MTVVGYCMQTQRSDVKRTKAFLEEGLNYFIRAITDRTHATFDGFVSSLRYELLCERRIVG